MNEKKQLSVVDIARLAGTSVATVSRVINQNGRFSKETEEKVLSIIRQYNYQPNQMARSLRGGQSRVIGILVPDISSEYYSSMTKEIQTALLAEDYLAIICNTDENIGVAILDSARNAGLDLNQLEPRRVKTQTVTGSYLLGKGELVGGFIGDGSSDGYFVRIKFKPDFVSDAENVMESIKYKKE